jgi:hypothetical protein
MEEEAEQQKVLDKQQAAAVLAAVPLDITIKEVEKQVLVEIMVVILLMLQVQQTITVEQVAEEQVQQDLFLEIILEEMEGMDYSHQLMEH